MKQARHTGYTLADYLDRRERQRIAAVGLGAVVLIGLSFGLLVWGLIRWLQG